MDNENHVIFKTLLDQGWFAPLIVTYLKGSDAMKFASTSRDCHVVCLQSPLVLPRDSFAEHGPSHIYNAKVWQHLPPLLSSPNKPHTVYLRCRWKDQGWGNKKGMLSVVAKGGRAPNDDKPCSKLVVCGETPAPHQWSPLSLSFCPDTEDEEKDPYAIWVRVGGGGGHQLNVEDLCIRVLTYTNST